MRIAILGTRGIPARYGGFETFAEELSTRLAAQGHEVVVYGRRRFFCGREATPIHYRGVTVRRLPTIMHKYFETPLHALISFLDLWRHRVDVVLLCNAANSPFAWIGRLRGIPVLINVDGIERRRAKWNIVGRLWYRLGELCSVWFASAVVADARTIAKYYLETFRCKARVIAYGAAPRIAPAGETLAKFGLKKDGYILYVSRLEPENNALGVIQAYDRLNTTVPLVVVGDAPYAKEYISQLQRVAGKGVIFTGYQFGLSYWELCSNCYMYIQATEVGGTHPALIENMACGNCIVANAVPEHLEVLAECGVYYYRNDFGHLSRQLELLLNDPARVNGFRQKARVRAQALYCWEGVCERYQELFKEVSQR
ncbi:MAG: glycosyltransferase family 1 protein [Deltaproteobacteria bacterium]|nr:glycosyltransferase family 1 protein [Deltaproteobacteria bacterium]